ncbi:MAG: SET domain-containing protein-lysine N-methyltransferase [Candidatus Acidiferrales bacterium]
MITHKPPGRTIPPQFSKFRLRIGRSPMHGEGVFAAETIAAGRKVIEYAGERSTWEEDARRARARRRRGEPRNVYRAYIGRLCVIDGTVGGTGAEFINHSCEPNLGGRVIRERLLLFSLRKIRRGEELSWDYRLSNRGPRVKCRCGSSKCRGTMNVK